MYMKPYKKRNGKIITEDPAALTRDGVNYRARESDEKYKSCIPRDRGREHIILILKTLEQRWMSAAEESRSTKPYDGRSPWSNSSTTFQDSYSRYSGEVQDLILRRACSGHISWDEFAELREYITVRSRNIWALDPTSSGRKYESWVDEVNFECPTLSTNALSATTEASTTSTPTVTAGA